MIINNRLFNLDLGKMTSKEKDLFFFILEKLSMATNREFEMKLFEIKKELGLYKRTDEIVLNTIRRMCKRFQETAQEIETEDGFEYFNVFEGQKINLKEETFMITLKKEFKYLINVDSKVKGEKQQGYTIIEDMKELYSIQSSYSKDLYLFIKRWESIGKKEIKIEEFKKMLKVPATYKMHHIDQKIISICLKDLSVYFIGLNIEKVKTGKKITKLIFTWQRVEKKKKVVQKKEIQRGIIKLKPSLGEEDLRKFEAEEKKISEIIDVNLADKVLKTENKVRENITREDYDRMYKEYLKNNNIAHNKFIKLAFDRSNESKFFIIK